MRDLRSRYVSIAATLATIVCVLTWVANPGAFGHLNLEIWLLLTPLLISAAVCWRWRAGLGELGYLGVLLLVEVSAVAFISRAQQPGATTAMEEILILPAIVAALFLEHRRHVGIATGAAVVGISVLVWMRAGADGSAPGTMVGQAFIVIFVTVLMRSLRDAAIDNLLRAERGEVTDPLTGLSNRRGLERMGGPHWISHAAQGHPLAFFVIDIDYFKKVNDELGHSAGDDLLKRLAVLLRQELRSEDLVVRLGGEEFLVVARVAPGGTPALAERLRQAIAEKLAPVTASVGALEVEPDPTAELPECIWDAVEHADVALYEAKRSGRNKVVLAH